MKKIVFFAIIALIGYGSKAQNIFPASGNVGIGTNTPTTKLEVKDGSVFVHGSVGGQGRLVMLKDGGGNQFEWYPQDAGLFLYNRTANLHSMSILNNGNVGVGTTTPDSEFNIFQSSNTEWASTIYNTGGEGKGLLIRAGNYGSVSNPILQLEDYNNNIRFKVQSNGKIGIGTSTPVGLLDVNGKLNAKEFNIDASYNNIWTSSIQNGGGRALGLLIKTGNGASSVDNYPTILQLEDYSGSVRFKVQSNGKVGIGTSTPVGLLDVNGKLNAKEFNIDASYNNIWTSSIQNGGGSALGLLIKTGNGASSTDNYPTILQLEDYSGSVRFKVQSNGKVGIGTSTPDAKLAVKGKIHAEEVLVDLLVPAPDYVFEENYPIKNIEEVEAYVKENKHLPEIPSASEMKENGIELGAMNIKLLQKIEELTLYLIEQNKRLKSQGDELIEQNKEIQQLKKEVKELKK